MAEIIDVRLPLDAINSQLNQLDQRFKKTENEAGKVGDKLDKGMDGAARSTKKVDTEQQKVTKNLKAQDKEAGKLTKTIRGLAPVITAAFAAQHLVRFTKELSRMAIEIQQLDQKAAIVFGKSLPLVTRESEKAANAIGLTAREFRSAAAGVADILVPLGFARRESAQLAVETTKLAGAISNWSGGQYSAAEAAQILQKALVGETEQLKSVGIVVDQTSKQFNERVAILQRDENLTMQQAKALEILRQVTQQSADAQTAFAEGTENIAVKLAQANARAREATEAFAEMITPALIGLTNAYATSISNLASVSNSSRSAFEKITTVLASFTGTAGQVALAQAVARADALAALFENIGGADAADQIAQLNEELREQLGLTEEQVTVERGLIEVLLEKKKLLDDQIKGATSQTRINELVAERERLETRINAVINQRQLLNEGQVVDELMELEFGWTNTLQGMDEANVAFEKSVTDMIDNILFAQVEKNEKEKQNAKAKSDFMRNLALEDAQAGLQAAQNLSQGLGDLFAKDAASAKAFAVFGAVLNAYGAILQVLNSPVPVNPIIRAALAASIGVQAFAQVARIKSQATPSFYRGTEYLKLGNNPKGRDTIPVMAHEGEAIIRSGENRKAPGLAKAWNEGKLDQWIRVKHVEPALRKKRQHAETQKAAVLASAMSGVFTAELNDGRILRQLKIANNIGEEQIRTIAKSIKRRNPYRA